MLRGPRAAAALSLAEKRNAMGGRREASAHRRFAGLAILAVGRCSGNFSLYGKLPHSACVSNLRAASSTENGHTKAAARSGPGWRRSTFGHLSDGHA